MHIAEGVLSPAVLGGGAVLALAGTAQGLRRLEYDRLVTVGILSAAFFVASLIHVPVGLASAHLVLNGLVGVLLGWAAFPSILVALLLQAYFQDIAESLGVFIPLIVVNCIILGRAEMFASKNGILDSALDGIGMGIGFTITLTIMGTIREILGSGTWMAGLDGLLPFLPEGFKIQVIPTSVDPFTLMTSAPGGFFVFGVMMAAATWLTTRPKKEKKPAETVEGGNA